MSEIRETCSCGATFQITSSSVHAAAHSWRRDHRHEFAPTPAAEPQPTDAGEIVTHSNHAGHPDTGLGFTTPALEDA